MRDVIDNIVLEAMPLDPFIIEKIREREKQRSPYQSPQPQLPIPGEEAPFVPRRHPDHLPDPDNDRGVEIIESGEDIYDDDRVCRHYS